MELKLGMPLLLLFTVHRGSIEWMQEREHDTLQESK